MVCKVFAWLFAGVVGKVIAIAKNNFYGHFLKAWKEILPKDKTWPFDKGTKHNFCVAYCIHPFHSLNPLFLCLGLNFFCSFVHFHHSHQQHLGLTPASTKQKGSFYSTKFQCLQTFGWSIMLLLSDCIQNFCLPICTPSHHQESLPSACCGNIIKHSLRTQALSFSESMTNE